MPIPVAGHRHFIGPGATTDNKMILQYFCMVSVQFDPAGDCARGLFKPFTESVQAEVGSNDDYINDQNTRD